MPSVLLSLRGARLMRAVYADENADNLQKFVPLLGDLYERKQHELWLTLIENLGVAHLYNVKLDDFELPLVAATTPTYDIVSIKPIALNECNEMEAAKNIDVLFVDTFEAYQFSILDAIERDPEFDVELDSSDERELHELLHSSNETSPQPDTMETLSADYFSFAKSNTA
jgi:hypothetical protein